MRRVLVIGTTGEPLPTSRRSAITVSTSNALQRPRRASEGDRREVRRHRARPDVTGPRPPRDIANRRDRHRS